MNQKQRMQVRRENLTFEELEKLEEIKEDVDLLE